MLKGSGPELRKPVRQTIREIASSMPGRSGNGVTAMVNGQARYLVHAWGIIGRTGGIEYEYYIRERGAPMGEWVCRVYDASLADFICAAMNQYQYGTQAARSNKTQQ